MVIAFVSATMAYGLTGQIIIEPAAVTDQTQPLDDANDLRPDQCATAPHDISVVKVMTDEPVLTGDNDGNLLLAGSATTDIVGGSEDDCIVGSPATTEIDGGGTGDTDVCIGSVLAGTVEFDNCEHEFLV